MRVEFSEIALAGIRKEFPDPSRQQSCFASLRFYLRRDHHLHSEAVNVFGGTQIYLYVFGGRWRVIYEVDRDQVIVWSYARR